MKNPLQFVVFSSALIALTTLGSAQDGSKAWAVVESATRTAAGEAGCSNHRCGASLGGQFDHADLVFEGIVSRVECRMSDASADGKAPRLPVTFVTFQILELFWGMAPQRDFGRITIRILGGAAPDGRILSVSGRPLFGVGQRDILMVRCNHRGVASVLHGSNRRFRLRGEEVFYESGREILASADGQLVPGALHDVAEFRRVSIGGKVIEQVVHDANAEEPTPTPATGDYLRLRAEDFRVLLRQLTQRASPEKYRSTKRVGDVSKMDRFILARSLRRRARDVRGAPIPEAERMERDAEQKKQ